MKHLARSALAAYALIVLGLALIDVRPGGDCGEYILMARAFVHHRGPDLRDGDAYWLARREHRLGGVASQLHKAHVKRQASAVGTVRTPEGRYYSIHFWFYSLLASPVLFLLEALGGPPLLALTAVNALAALLAGAYLLRCFRGTWLAFVAPAVFLLGGATFYLRFTGAEALTASGVLVAALAMGRGELGIGFLATGVAATQNPSAAALFPFIAFEAWRLRRFSKPQTGAHPPRLDRRALELALAGLLLCAMPYVFYKVTYGVPSLIGTYAVDRRLIGFERLWSLFFDLNQGMASGLPGLFVGLAGALALTRSRPAAARALVTLGAVLAMSVPTLAAPNWNSGAVVFMRYAYWLAMPLLALFLELLARLPLRSGVPVLGVFAALQFTVLGLNGLRGEASSYLRHGWLANAVLSRAPGAYNPVIEVFVERTLGREVGWREERAIAWPRHGTPMKILVHERAKLEPPEECPPGGERIPSSIAQLGGGWRYQNGPFRCAPARAH